MKPLSKKFVSIICLALLAALVGTPANAARFLGPDGLVWSNVCVAPGGAYMVFRDGTAGPVGSPCSFGFINEPGVIHYGTFN